MAEHIFNLEPNETIDTFIEGPITKFSVSYNSNDSLYGGVENILDFHFQQKNELGEYVDVSEGITLWCTYNQAYISFNALCTTGNTTKKTYVAGMTWNVELDYDTRIITVTNPDNTIETFNMNRNVNIDAIVEFQSHIYSYGEWIIYLGEPPPLWEGDISIPDGGGGNADTTTDGISIPEPPSVTALSCNMVKMYHPTLSELSSLASFLWSTSFYDNIVKLFQNPMEAIISLSMIPVTLPSLIGAEIIVGKVGTGVTSDLVLDQFITLDCGTISVNEYWGNSLDFNPYTKVQIYLPFVGTHTLNTDDIMKGDINVTYNIDMLTGACMVFITVIKDSVSNVLYSFSGNVASQVPLSASNLTSIITSIAGMVASAGVTYATGGLAAPLVAGSAMSMLNAKAHIERSGRLDSSVGLMAIKKPYLIITRPVQSLAENYNHYRGFPSNMTRRLGDLTGYTEVDIVYMTGKEATQEEIKMIESMLKGGIIL